MRSVEPAASGYSSGLANSIRAAAGDTKWRYLCADCDVRGRKRFAKLVGMMVLLVALSWGLRELGWL